MKKKGFKQSILSVLLILSIVVSTLYNGDIVKADTSNITLNILDGTIAVTNQTYSQTNSSGTVINQGTVPTGGELVLTGTQGNAYNVTLSGTNIPTIRFKGVNTAGNITGTATGTLNVIVEDNCVFSNGIINNLTAMTTININGVEGNLCSGKPYIQGATNNTYINVNGVNFKNTLGIAGIYAMKNISVSNCTYTSVNSYAFGVQNTSYLGNTYNATITNCKFDTWSPYFGSNITIDNVVAGDSIGTTQYTFSYATNCETLIKNSDLKATIFSFGGTNTKIINSKLESVGYYFNATGTGNLYLQGSTLINSGTSNDITTYSNSGVSLLDNSLIFKSAPGTSNRFYNATASIKARFDPVDTSGNFLYLNKVQVPNAASSKVTVSIDGRTAVKLWTDASGYLYLYLPTGSHEVNVTDVEGKNYYLSFNGATARETTTTSNVIGTMEETGDPVTITFTPFANTNIEYSFNKTKWNTITTDGNCNFQVIFPNGSSLIYLRVNGVIYTATLKDGTIGTITEAVPKIISTSKSPSYFAQGQDGSLFVYAEPFDDSNNLSYQWFKDGIEIDGATDSVYTMTNMQISDIGNYTCEVSEPNIETASTAPISVLIGTGGSEDTGELKILSQSNNKTLIEGYSTELYVNAKPARSADELTYDWYKDGEEFLTATNSAITLNSVTLEDSGTYICRIYEDEDYTESDPIQVTVEKNPLEDDVNDLNTQVEILTSQVGNLTEQIDTLNNEKKNLQDTIDGLSDQITSYTNQITTLQNSVTDLESQLLNSEKDKDELTQQIQDLNNLISGLNQQISTLEDKLLAANDEKTVLESKITDLTTDIANLNSQITLLEQKLADSEQENADLKNQVNNLQETISNLESQVDDLRDDVEELTDQNNQLLSQVEGLTSQKADLENEIQRLLDLLDDANTTIGNLTEQVNTLNEAVNDLTSQLNTANGEKTVLQNTITGLQEEITSKDTLITDLNKQITDLENALQQEGADKEALYETISNLNNKITELNQTISSLQTQLDDVTGQKDALQDTVDNLNDQVNDYKNQLADINEKLTNSEEENTSLKQQVTELQDTISNLNKNIADLDSQLDSMTTENNSLHNQLDEANDTIQSLLNQIDELLQENASLQEQLSNAQKQINDITADLTTEQQKNTNLQNELSEALNDLQEISALLGSPTADKQDILNSITEIKNEISSLNSQLQDSNGIINSLNEQITNLTTIADNLQSKIDAAMDGLSEYEGAELQDKISSIINDNKNLSGRVTELEEQNSSLLEQISQMNNTINNLLIQIGDLEEENSKLTEQLNHAEETIVSLQEQLTEQISLNNELQNQVNDLISNLSDLQTQLSDANADKEELQNQINNLQTDYNTLTQQLEESNDKITDLNQQIKDLNEVIKKLQEQIDDALDSLSDYEGNSLKEKIEDILEKQAGIKDDLANANNLNSTLNNQLNEATGQLSYLQAEIERLTGVLEDKDAEIARLNALLQQQNSENATLTSRITELENENQTLKEENELLKKQIDEGNPDNEEELQQLRDQLAENEKKLAEANTTIESLKNQLANQTSGQSSGTVVNDDEYVVVPQTSTTNNVEEIVKETVISDSDADTIESNSGWELSSSLSADAEWGDTLQPTQDSSYTGVFTFFDNGLNSTDVQTLSNNLIGKSELLSVTVPGVGLQEKKLLSDTTAGNYVKYTFYARRVNDKNKIYVCEVNVVKTDYTTPVTKLSSSVKSDPRNYTAQNTYTTKVDGKVVFRATADYGTIGKGSVKYQVVPEDEDFDPDGNWTEVNGETFTVPEQKENYRVYIKYTDKAGNFTVDKTIGFNVGTKNVSSTEPEKVTQSSVPVFEIGKTIELGNSYKINMANVSNDAQITFKSSDKKIATVSKTGIITAKSLGNAVVSGIVIDGNYTYKFKVNVSVVKGVYGSTLNLKQISTIDFVDGKPVVVIYKLCSQGESIKLNTLETTDAQITYKSSNERVATVSKEGKVTGKGKGRTNIIVTVTQDGITYTYMVVVRVTDGTDDLEMWEYLTD